MPEEIRDEREDIVVLEIVRGARGHLAERVVRAERARIDDRLEHVLGRAALSRPTRRGQRADRVEARSHAGGTARLERVAVAAARLEDRRGALRRERARRQRIEHPGYEHGENGRQGERGEVAKCDHGVTSTGRMRKILRVS